MAAGNTLSDPEAFPLKTRTMNDLTPEQVATERKAYVQKNIGVLRKYFSFVERERLRQGLFGKIFAHVPEIESNSRYVVPTVVSFSISHIEIPVNLAIASEMLLSRRVINRGVFRVNTTEQRLVDIKSLIFGLAEERIIVKYGKEIIDENFDPIDIAESYKQMLRGFSTPVIPYGLLNTAKKIQKISDEREKKICTKAFLYALPNLNRRILDNDIYLCHSLVDRMEKSVKNKEQMGIDGMGVVMMPNLFMKPDTSMGIEDVLTLVEFVKFLFKNFRELIASEGTVDSLGSYGERHVAKRAEEAKEDNSRENKLEKDKKGTKSEGHDSDDGSRV